MDALKINELEDAMMQYKLTLSNKMGTLRARDRLTNLFLTYANEIIAALKKTNELYEEINSLNDALEEADVENDSLREKLEQKQQKKEKKQAVKDIGQCEA